MLQQGSKPQADENPEADVLGRTKVHAALSAGLGSALAFVSEHPDHVVCIDACVVNPSYMAAGEQAEAVLLDHLASTALAGGAAEVRLHKPLFQTGGDAFYGSCGFIEEREGAEEGARILCRRF